MIADKTLHQYKPDNIGHTDSIIIKIHPKIVKYKRPINRYCKTKTN